MERFKENVTVQGIGGVVGQVNQIRADQYIKNIRFQNMNLDEAIGELNKAREFIGSPEHILGSMGSKHGEIAEVFEVRFGNADKIIRGENPNYTFDGVGRTAAEDYLKNNLPVQSKFVQSNLSMDAVLEHLKKYPDFVSKGGTYCIPKDYYEQIQAWSKLSSEELAKLPAPEGGRIARNVMDRIKELEEKTGKSFRELVEPAQVKYNQVQLRRASDTLDAKEQEIIEVDGKRREEYWKMAQASVKEGFKVAGISAVISGVVSFATSLTGALRSRKKKLDELTKEDWTEIFKQTGIGTLKGGVQGGAIYALTNGTEMSAPVAAAFVSATLGIAAQALKLGKREISFDEFMYNILDLSVETAVSGIGAAVGQALIPVPVLGAVVGSIVSTKILALVKKYIFDGGYYEQVEVAFREKAFSDEYLPLAKAFESCSAAFNKSMAEYARNMNTFWNRRSPGESGNIVDLNQTLDYILNS